MCKEADVVSLKPSNKIKPEACAVVVASPQFPVRVPELQGDRRHANNQIWRTIEGSCEICSDFDEQASEEDYVW